MKALFGIEVEFYIVNQQGYPVLGSNESIRNVCLTIDPSLCIVQELSSFQIEINPGPWQINSNGLQECINELKRHYDVLNMVVSKQGWKLCETLMPQNITQDLIDHSNYFSRGTRFKASTEYFKNRDIITLKNSSAKLRFPGEAIIGCINEIHIHAQLSDDEQTLALFNYLNCNGLELTKQFNQLIEIAGQPFYQDSSIELFEQANGEWNSEMKISRVGNLPKDISSYDEYKHILGTFEKIPSGSDRYLDLESTVYFWTRLRESPGKLRVEFRPMEMGENWLERVIYLYQIIKDFEVGRLQP